MSADADSMYETVNKLREEVGELKTVTRVTKHDVANLQQTMTFINTRLEKIQDQIEREVKEMRSSISSEMRSISDKVGAETKLLSAEIAGINTKQERSAGFYAGVMAVGTIAVAIVLGLVKIIFGIKL